MRFGVIPQGGLEGLPCLILGDEYETAQQAFDAILGSRGPGTKAVWFDTARSWDVDFMSQVNLLLNLHPATVDLTMYMERGIVSKLWPHSSDTMWISVDCSELMDGCNSPIDLQRNIVDSVGPLPVPNEIVVKASAEMLTWLTPAYLDMIFTTVMPGEAYLVTPTVNYAVASSLLNKCHTDWRLGHGE